MGEEAGRCPLCRIQVGRVTVIGPKSREKQVEEAAKHLAKLCRNGKEEYKSIGEALRELERAGVVEIVKRSDGFWKVGLAFDMISLFAFLGVPTLVGLMLTETWYEVRLKDRRVCEGWPVEVWLQR